MIPEGMVRTVTGDVAAQDLGVTYMHEHLIIDSATVAERWPHILLTDTESAIKEVTACEATGVGTMVDTMPMASGRGPERLAEIAASTGVNIVMATGLHTPKYYESLPWVDEASADQLAEWFIADIKEGGKADDHLGDEPADRTSHRAGIVKAATDERGMDARAKTLFEAVAIAVEETGAPVITHCEEGLGGLEQVAELARHGVPLGAVVLSHTDKVGDSNYHTALLETGVNLEFDQALRQREAAVDGTAGLLAELIEAGFEDQLMLGTDGARRTLWSCLGGNPGLAWMAGPYREILTAVGIDEGLQHKLFVENPARALASTGQLRPPFRADGESGSPFQGGRIGGADQGVVGARDHEVDPPRVPERRSDVDPIQPLQARRLAGPPGSLRSPVPLERGTRLQPLQARGLAGPPGSGRSADRPSPVLPEGRAQQLRTVHVKETP